MYTAATCQTRAFGCDLGILNTMILVNYAAFERDLLRIYAWIYA